MSKEYTISIAKANTYAFLLLIPIGLLLGIPYIIVHGFSEINFGEFNLVRAFGGFLKVALIFLLGAVFHELLHALGWVFFTRGKWKAIRFGIKWEYLTPYCHCKEPLTKWQFSIGAVLPCIVLGIVPCIVSYVNGNIYWWVFGFFFTAAAGGDIIVLWMLRKVRFNEKIKDHPSELGFIIDEEVQDG